MKRRFLILPVLSFLGVLGSVLVLNKPQSTNAYFENNTEFNENFDSKTIDSSKWTATNAETNIENYSLRFHPTKYEWVDQLLLQSDEYNLSKSYVIETEITSNATSTAWQAFSFGVPDKNLKFSDAPFALIFYPSYLSDSSLTAIYANTDKSGFLEPVNGFLYATPFDKPNVFRRLRITVNLVDSKSSTVFYDVLDTNGNYVKQHSEKDIITVNAPLSGYVGLNNSGLPSIFRNFKISDLETGDVIYNDDFTKSSIQYVTEGEGDWCTSTFSKEDVVLGPLANLKLKGDNSSLISINEFKKSNSNTIDCLFSQEVTIKYGSMSRNSVAGIEIGKQSKTENGYLFGLKKNENGFGYSLVIYDKNMNLLTSVKSPIDATGSEARLLLKVYCDNSCVLTCGDYSLKTTISSVDGYYGLKNVSIDGNACEGPNIDDYVMYTTLDQGMDAPDAGMNFDGTRDTLLGQLKVKQFFVPKTEWQFSSTSDFSLASYEETGIPGDIPNGYAIFDNCTNMTIFGTKQKYTNFVARFDVQILTKPNYLKENGGFALEFGIDKYTTYYDNLQSLGLYNTNSLGSPVSLAMAHHATMLDGGNTLTFPVAGTDDQFINFFDMRNNDYPILNMMYVIKDGYASMFFKYDDEPEEVLLKPRMVCKAEKSTTGYVAVVGTQGITFSLDNFSITNLDYIEKEVKYTEYDNPEYQVTTRKDFRVNNGDTSGLVLNSAKKTQNALEIANNGAVKTVGKVLNGLTRVRLNSLEEKVEFKYDDVSISFIDDNVGKRIEAKDKSGIQKYELDNNFKFTNAFVEIEKIDGTFNISLCSGDKPLSAMGDIKTSFNLTSVGTYSNLEIISKGLTRLSTFTYVNYDTHFIFTTRNYDPAIDAVVSWVEKKSIQELEAEKNKGCKGSIISSSIVVTFVSALLCLFLFLRRKENN